MRGFVLQGTLYPGPVFPLLTKLQYPAQLYTVSVDFPLDIFLLLEGDNFVLGCVADHALLVVLRGVHRQFAGLVSHVYDDFSFINPPLQTLQACIFLLGEISFSDVSFIIDN